MFENLIKLSASFWILTLENPITTIILNGGAKFESILYTTTYAIMYKIKAKIGAPII